MQSSIIILLVYTIYDGSANILFLGPEFMFSASQTNFAFFAYSYL